MPAGVSVEAIVLDDVVAKTRRRVARKGRRTSERRGILDPMVAPPFSTTTVVAESQRIPDASDESRVTVLAIAWCASEPWRVGEIAVIADGGPAVELGRGPGERSTMQRLRFFRQRPGVMIAGPPLAATGISRQQLELRPADGPGRIRLVRTGKCVLEMNGHRTDDCLASDGDVIALRRELVLYCVRRPALIPPARLFREDDRGDFGEVDRVGILGESPYVWRLREELAFAAKSDTHVLVLGESGTGKELAARALHRLSARADRPFVARNAATLPSGLIDAELFGNARNYPNPGMPERAGLVGEADGGTLFLDEIGELPTELQAHLLRVLDGEGEYQRLGESSVRRSRFRLVAATNRPLGALKHDFAARIASRVELPPLALRREDIPLLVRHTLLRAALRSPEVVRPFVARAGGCEYPRIDPDLVVALLRAPFSANLRELEAILWRAMSLSRSDTIECPSELRRADALDAEADEPGDAPSTRPAERPRPGPDDIRRALESCAGNVADAAHSLGLSSRYALYRLMKKLGIEAEGSDG